MSYFRRREPAQIMVLFGFILLFAMLGLIGLVVNGGNIYVQRRTAQISADAAALAGTQALQKASSNSADAISSAVCTFARANAFGVTPTVTTAYFVGTDNVTNVGTIGLMSPCGTAGSGGTIPNSAAGVHVEVSIPFTPYLPLPGILNLNNVNAVGTATAQVGVLTGFDVRNPPFIICGGTGSGSSFSAVLATQTPVVLTTTPGKLANTPASLPAMSNPNIVTRTLLVTPSAGSPPSYVVNPALDGLVLYIKGQFVTQSGADCTDNGFKGGTATNQPTPYIQNVNSSTPAVIYGDTGNRVPQIAQRAASANACSQTGTAVDQAFPEGRDGCVMVLPIASSASSSAFYIGAWGAFYVWCLNATGSGCQEYAGQYLGNWPIASGASASIWTFGAKGGMTVVRLTR